MAGFNLMGRVRSLGKRVLGLTDLSDVDTTGLDDGEVLIYDSASGTFQPGTVGGAVDSVNGNTGVVVLDADDIDDSATTHRFATAAQLSKLDGIEAGATADQSGAEIVTSIDTELGSSDWQSGGGGGGGAPHVGFVSGRYYSSPNMGPALATVALGANYISAIPIYIDAAHTLTEMGLYVNSATAGASARVGLYTNSNGLPDARLDQGEVSIATTGKKGIVISQSLSADWYWLLFVSSGTANLLGAATTNNIAWEQLGVSSVGTTYYNMARSYTYASLPDPAGSGWTLYNSNGAPYLYIG